MKHIFLFCIIVYLPRIAASQDTINPFNIAQPMNIILQNTDVYYCPVEPPAPYDTRALLCTPSSILRDSNGIFETTPYYDPITHDTEFQYFNPCTSSWGGQWSRIWQRLFTAKRKADGTPSDIIAGGGAGDTVSISPNEDVDFRASGTIKMENGFHVHQGAFFHAYIEPTWGPVVFSDDFDSTVIDRTKWYVANGSNAESGGIEELSDSNVVIDTDYQASDGHALDIMLRENLDTFAFRRLNPSWIDSCLGSPVSSVPSDSSVFSSALVRTCPWPMQERTAALPMQMAYQHMPYGKYEIREKTPHILHHINNWLYGSFEIDMNEEAFNDQQILHPNVHHHLHIGPDTGHFYILPGPDSVVIFVSKDAGWCPSNQPDLIFINNFAYDVQLHGGKDTAIGADTSVGTSGIIGGIRNWPYSLKYDTSAIPFYYSYSGSCVADTVTWNIDSSGRIFSAPYHVIAPGDSLRFTKNYQATSITLTISGPPHDSTKTLNCHWSAYLNSSGDTGRLYIDTVAGDTSSLHRIVASDYHTFTEPYPYTVSDYNDEYEPAAVPFDWQDTAPSSYQYHTFGIELLPYELRYLIDSAVVLRVPDRLIPPGTRQYDLVKNLDRSPMNFFIGELDMDQNHPNTNYDPFGTDTTGTWDGYPTSTTYLWRHQFERATANGWAGCWPVQIPTGSGPWYPAAHKLIDYVRVWDVPAGTPIPNFPN